MVKRKRALRGRGVRPAAEGSGEDPVAGTLPAAGRWQACSLCGYDHAAGGACIAVERYDADGNVVEVEYFAVKPVVVTESGLEAVPVPVSAAQPAVPAAVVAAVVDTGWAQQAAGQALISKAAYPAAVGEP